jgi:indole-3-glycerol phosphate synthase
MSFKIGDKEIQIIAEVKMQSPFGFKSEKNRDELFALACKVGDIISIHTDARWGGSFELLADTRAKTDKPILAKGIHATDALLEKAIEVGADFVLVVGRIPDFSHMKILAEKILIEPNSLAELAAIPHNYRVVWNSRDLKTGGLKKETFAEARELFPGWLCQASNIRTFADVHPQADAILVGEHLEGFAESL